jgi:2-oxoglutarate ferredoxin oxidoreductase subunit gamma
MFEAIFAGFGGQGVMLMGQLVAYSGMYEGKNVSWVPSYGPEMRGGTANCSVVVSEAEIGSPVFTAPNVLVAMNRPSLEKFEAALQPGGLLFYNSSLIDIKPNRTDITIVAVPANDLAEKLGNSKVANMIVLGAIIKKTGIVNVDTAMHVLTEKVLTGRKEKLIPINRVALDKGIELAG